MRKNILILAALAATAGLVYTVFHFPFVKNEAPSARFRLARVWVTEQEPSVWAWLKKQVKQYEKETGTRVYLRAVSANMPADAVALPPDLLISSNGEEVLALEGYALFYRDETARSATPYPTSLLFFRPSPTPGPSPTPAPSPDIARFASVLAPIKLPGILSGIVRSAHPVQDFSDGKGDAAILTAGQAEKLPFHVGAYPLAAGTGSFPVRATANTSTGRELLKALLSEKAQRTLPDAGLYSPVYKLYQGADPFREMIENSL